MHCRHSRSQYGFTLIELLVVMAIITILAALLFPVFAQARKRTEQIVCMSNIRQIGMAVQTYTQDYDERLPFVMYGSNSPHTQFDTYFCQNGNRCGYRWADMVLPYVHSTAVFACPSDRRTYSWDNPSLAKISYGLNGYAYWFHGGHLDSQEQGPGPALPEVPRPAEHILLTEVTSHIDSATLWCFRAPQMNHNAEQNPCVFKHGWISVMYFDGHAKIIKMHGLLDQSPYVQIMGSCSQNTGCMSRYYPEWAPWLP